MNSIELAKRAVACKHWRWMPGMLTLSGVRVEFTSDTDAPGEYDLGHACGHLSSRDELPALDDPATLGCLLHLVREAWGDPLACITARNENEWTCWVASSSEWRCTRFEAATEAEALVAALEAAP